MIRFEVLGEPAPKGSYRAINVRGRAIMVPSGDDKRKAARATWDQSVREQARAATLAAGYDLQTPAFVDEGVRVLLTFRLRRPKGHWGKHGVKPTAPPYPAVKPDVDKLERAILDALTGIAYADDAQVCEVIKSKVYASPGDEGASITVEAMDYRPPAAPAAEPNLPGVSE